MPFQGVIIARYISIIIYLRTSALNMVKEVIYSDRIYYICEICGLAYPDRETASECEEFCRNNPGSCSLKISSKAVGRFVSRGGRTYIKFYRNYWSHTYSWYSCGCC